MGILSNLFERRSDLSIPTQSRPLIGLLGLATKSKTGVYIDSDTALSSSAVWSAVMQLSQAVGSLPLHLYKRLNPRGKERYSSHPCYHLLHLQPNPEMTSMVFREVMTGQVLIYGTAYAEKQLNGVNKITALWPLISSKMELRRSNTAELYYRYQMPDGKYHYFNSNQILRITGFSSNGLLGYCTYEKMSEPIGLSLALEEYASRFFSNGATPPSVLEHPASLSQEAQDRLRDNWSKVYGGLSNAHRIAILEEGMKLNTFGIDPEHAQAIESRKFMIDEVARIFNMPPHMLKQLGDSSYNNIEEQALEFIKYTLRPWLVRFEQAYNTQLLSIQEQDQLFFEHLVDGLLRGDTETRHQAYATGRQWGYYSANDVREMENMNPVEGGDLYMVPLNMIPADQMENPSEPEKPDIEEITDIEETKAYWRNMDVRAAVSSMKRVEYSHIPLFQDAAQRIINKEVSAIKKAVKNHLRDIQSFEQWVDEFYEGMPEYIRRVFWPVQYTFTQTVVNEALRMIGKKPLSDMTPEMVTWANDYMEVYISRYTGSSVGQLKNILKKESAETVADAITLRADDWSTKRAAKVAKNETTRLANFISMNTWRDSGIKKKRWVTVGTSCPYCKKLDGKIVEIERNFMEAGSAIHAQYEITNEDGTKDSKWGSLSIKTNMAHPPAHAGCDCGVAPE